MHISTAVVDQHVHSNFSPDSEESLESIVRQAQTNGKQAVVTTDHFDYDCKYFKQDVVVDMPKYEEEVARLSKEYDIEIRKGIEVGFRQDYKEQIDDFLSQYSFDVVLLSVHNNGILDYAEERFHDQPAERIFETYFMSLIDAVQSMDNFDIVAHLDYFVRYSKRGITLADYDRSRSLLYDLLKLIIQKDKVLELNTAGLFIQGWIHPHSSIIDMYIDLGGKLFSLGSDAHQLAHIEKGFREAIDLLQSYGVNEIVQFRNRIPYTVAI